MRKIDNCIATNKPARQYVGPHRWDSSAKYFNFLEVSAWWTFPIYERCLALTYKPIPLAFTEEKQVIDMHCEIFHINNEYKPKIKFFATSDPSSFIFLQLGGIHVLFIPVLYLMAVHCLVTKSLGGNYLSKNLHEGFNLRI